MTDIIDWNTDRHTIACRAAGLPTPWVDAAPTPAGGPAAGDMPHLEKWLDKCRARFKHNRPVSDDASLASVGPAGARLFRRPWHVHGPVVRSRYRLWYWYSCREQREILTTSKG